MKTDDLVRAQDGRGSAPAFTRIELLAAVAMIALLAALAAGGFARERQRSRAFECLNHARQLAAGSQLYCSDNHELFPPNPDDGNTLPGYNWCPGGAGEGQENEFDPQILRDPARSLIIRYLGTNVDLFRCTADIRRGLAGGQSATVPGLAGTSIPNARSVSMNGGVGTVDSAWLVSGTHSGKPTRAVTGPWITGSHNENPSPQLYATFGRTSDFARVGASGIFLTLEEAPGSINDANFSAVASIPYWVDSPATFHENGCGFSFCDGHAEIHPWAGTALSRSGQGFLLVAASDPDWLWVSSHATYKLQ